MIATDRILSRKTVVGYAVGSLGTGGFSTLPGLVLIYYLTDTLGVAALAAGILVTVAKIWDVIINPVIGARSDRSLVVTRSRRRFMVLGGALIPVFFILTFAVPAGLEPFVSGLWVFLAFLLAATAFSLFQVPYIALPAELVSGYDQRTRLITWRVVVLTVAILLFGAGGPALRGLAGGGHLGYLLMAIVAGVVIGAGMLASSTIAPRNTMTAADVPRISIAQNYVAAIRVLQRSRPFRALMLTFLLQGLATGLMLAGAQYVATWVLHSEKGVTFLFLALIAPAIVFAPVWGLVARSIGKERAFVISSIMFGSAALSLLGLLWAAGSWIYLPVAVAGAAYAGMQTLPLAMLPDVISHDAAEHGDGHAGTFSGVWTAGETTGIALGATVLTVVLAVSGYAQSTAGITVTQTPGAIAGIVVSFSVVPAAIMAFSLVPLARYRLRKQNIDGAA